ncbi:MAG: site-2 protease family protein [Gammaproteobacteria bacterium]
MLALGGFVFGWAKPVPVNMNRLRNPLPDMAIVAAAGPLSNLVMALGWALIAKIGVGLYAAFPCVATRMILMGQTGIAINLILCLLNLLPLPPLDGGRVLAGFLPHKAAYAFSRIEPFGLFIIIGVESDILFPVPPAGRTGARVGKSTSIVCPRSTFMTRFS